MLTNLLLIYFGIGLFLPTITLFLGVLVNSHVLNSLSAYQIITRGLLFAMLWPFILLGII